MKKRLSMTTVCIIVIALFFGANTTGCGDSNNSSWYQPNPGIDPIVNDPPDTTPETPTLPAPLGYWVSTEGSDSNPGTPEEPFRTILKASIEANNNPHTIYVFPGTYTEGSLHLPAGVHIYGLGSLTADPMKYRPVIDMQSDCSGMFCSLYLYGGENGGETTIDGVRIFAKRRGIVLYDTSLTLTNSEINVEGTDIARGLAFYISEADTVDAIVRNNVITTQESPEALTAYGIEISSGGNGVATINILDNTITVDRSAGTSTGIISNNYGGRHQDLLIRKNTITANSTARYGNGVYIIGTNTSRIEQNFITVGSVENDPVVDEGTQGILISGYGAAARTQTTVLNNAIVAGRGGNWAYGIALHYDVDATVLFNTIDAGGGAGTSAIDIGTYVGVASTIQNNILCAGTAQERLGIVEHDSTMVSLKNNLFCENYDALYMTASQNVVQDTYVSAISVNTIGNHVENNAVGDPNFFDMPSHDYRLSVPSDAINVGRLVIGVDQDLVGNARVIGVAPDIGAYEIR